MKTKNTIPADPQPVAKVKDRAYEWRCSDQNTPVSREDTSVAFTRPMSIQQNRVLLQNDGPDDETTMLMRGIY